VLRCAISVFAFIVVVTFIPFVCSLDTFWFVGLDGWTNVGFFVRLFDCSSLLRFVLCWCWFRCFVACSSVVHLLFVLRFVPCSFVRSFFKRFCLVRSGFGFMDYFTFCRSIGLIPFVCSFVTFYGLFLFFVLHGPLRGSWVVHLLRLPLVRLTFGSGSPLFRSFFSCSFPFVLFVFR